MNYDQLYQILAEQNPWWNSPEYLPMEAKWYKRAQLAEISANLDIPLMLSLTGVRRTGKTTIMRQILAEILLRKNVPTNRIMFFSFDEEIIARNANVLEGIIKTFLDRVLKEEIWNINERVFIFLDEVQDILHWQATLKRFYDQNKNIKFIISGSASLFIREKTKESLAGRIFEYHILPLGFREYLELCSIDIKIPKINIFDLKNSNADIKKTILESGEKLQGLFSQFLIKGSFPEAAALASTADVFKYIKETMLNKVLMSDIPKHFGIQKYEELGLLFRSLCRDTAQVVEYKNIAQECALSIDTISSYVNCFRESLLIDILYNYTRSARKQLRTQKKIYVASPNFTAALFGIHEFNQMMSGIAGHMVETYAYWKLKTSCDNMFFMRELEKEVDFFCQAGNQQILVESKYTENIRESDIKAVPYFMKKRKIKNGIILTKNIFDVRKIEGEKITFLPVWCL